MSLILITPLSALPDALSNHVPSHLVTLLSSGYMIETPSGFPAERHLRLSMHDIADEGVLNRRRVTMSTVSWNSREDGMAPRRCWSIAGLVSAARPLQPTPSFAIAQVRGPR